MVKIVSSKPTTLQLLEAPTPQAPPRPYLGMSGLGHSCSRYLWYEFRWAFKEDHSTRLKRLFSRGHREEVPVVRDLERIGISCKNYGTEDQVEMEAGFGHMKGHSDGICENVPEAPKTTHLLEIKTVNDKGFKKLCKMGLKAANPKYYAQVQLYMHFLKLKRALHITVNKNDDAYYVERIRYDRTKALELIQKGEGIILSEQPPMKVYTSTWWECKFCSAFSICHRDTVWEKNCRTCRFVSPEHNGEWSCNIQTAADSEPFLLTLERQRQGCANHQQIQVS